ncbi:S-layer homology domain-containing protein [Jeotgalibacillus sp. JSM ZJ347]|uniref:S-layer homology domain-containing protein n=1 Tax=Jeotgalibacillus sp. JSM ZJ347 TaxID=3342117 RepID=UPI0035A97382
MKKRNRYLAGTAFSVSAAVMVAPVASAMVFTDVNERYMDAVNYLVDEEITVGITETKFGTNLNIKRVDAAIMLARALNLDVSAAPPSGFTDVPERGVPFVNALKDAGITNGKSSTQFDAQSSITRGEIALLLANAYILGESNVDKVKFTDVPERYFAAVNALLNSGITQGKTETRFGTNDPITRGEFAIFLYRISEFPMQGEDGRSALSALLDMLDDYDENYYTNDSWMDFEDAWQNGQIVADDMDATDEEIEQAIDDILAAIDGLVLEEIIYTRSNDEDETMVTLTFSNSIGTDGMLMDVKGTLADGDFELTGNGLELMVSGTDADTGDSASFDLNLGGTDITAELTWNGAMWEMDSVPTDIFVDGGVTLNDGEQQDEVDALIDLELLDDGLIDGSISIDDLLNGDLLRINLLPGEESLLAGETISLTTNDFTIAEITLSEDDVNSGFVDVGLSTDLLKNFNGGENLEIDGTITRENEVLNGVIGDMKLPLYPLVDPVLDLTGNTVSDLLYILSGDTPLRVNLEGETLDQIEPGAFLTIQASGGENVELQTTITQEDINNGYVELTFTNEGLVERLLEGLTVGETITFTPVISDGEQVSTGDPIEIEVSQGLLDGILVLLDELLNGGVLGSGLLNGLLGDLLGGNGDDGGLLDDLIGGLL